MTSVSKMLLFIKIKNSNPSIQNYTVSCNITKICSQRTGFRNWNTSDKLRFQKFC